MEDNVVYFDKDTPKIEQANKVKSLLAVNGEDDTIGSVEFDLLVIEAGKHVGDTVKIDGLVLPTLGEGNKRATVRGGSTGKTFTYGSTTIEIGANMVADLFWDGTAGEWSKVEEVEMPMQEGTNIVIEGGDLLLNQDGGYKIDQKVKYISKVSPQLFDKSANNLELGSIIATGLVGSNHNFRAYFDNSVLEPGKTYTINKVTTVSTSNNVAVVFFDDNDQVIGYIPRVQGAFTYTFTIPSETSYTYVHIGFLENANTYPLHDNAVVNTVMLAEGSVALDFTQFGSIIGVDPDKIERYTEVLELIDEQPIVLLPIKNLINPIDVDFSKRYSPASTSIVNPSGTIYVLTDYIPVIEGEWYVVSNDNNSSMFFTGGYFAENTSTNALQNILFINPVDNIGKAFQVPVGLGIKFVAINLETTSVGSGILNGNYQLERGEQSTSFEPFEIVKRFNPEYIDNSSGGGGTPTTSELDKFTAFDNLSYGSISDKIPIFRAHWFNKDKDLVVVNTGTSLTARSIEHCTDHELARERPPLMHSYNFATHIWDKIKWDNQYYRRYDYDDYFTESGNFQTQSNIADWDDGAYRSGLTRFSDGNEASISFVVPQNAWQFNFIYRSDSVATETATISIAQGNGQMEVWNGVQWVEANGYVFSQKEPAPALLPSVTFVNPQTGGNSTITNYQVKGNTTYQKRLKMRCKGDGFDSRNIEKEITISAGIGRLLYWGVEWSIREFMITYINAARGSHSSLINSSATNLSKYQDNEVWSFIPDLILTEDPIHNSGAAGLLNSSNPSTAFGIITENFFFDNTNQVSMVARATTLGISVPEMVIFNSTISWNFNGIDENGELILSMTADGRLWSAVDAQMSCYRYINDNYQNVIYINAIKNWVLAAISCYGNLRSATVGSGKGGKTFTNEGSHWNDTGSRIMARVVLPVLDFTI